MRIKWLGAALAAAVLLGALPGCTLADPEDGGAAEEDRLVGMYITPEYLDLFDIEGYLENNLSFAGGEVKADGDASAYQGRLYAMRDESGNYVFETDGVGAFIVEETDERGDHCTRSMMGPGVAGNVSIGGEAERLDAEIRLDARKGNAAFFNPVYQTAGGEVYLTAGTGMSVSLDSDQPGGSFSQSMETSVSSTGPDGNTVTRTFTVEISASFWTPPDRIAVTQMSENGQVLRRDEFAGEELPDRLEKAGGTAYYIVEEYRAGLETQRTLETGDAEYLWFTVAGEGIFCTDHGVELR